MTILTQTMETEQNFLTQILVAVIYIKTKDFFQDISNDVERWFGTSNYNENDKRHLGIGKNKKIPGLFKDELGGKIIRKVVALRPKTYVYLTDDDNNYNKAKGTKNETVYRSQERLRSYYHDMYTEEINKIVLRSNDDKRLQTYDKIATYPYGTIEMIMINK